MIPLLLSFIFSKRFFGAAVGLALVALLILAPGLWSAATMPLATRKETRTPSLVTDASGNRFTTRGAEWLTFKNTPQFVLQCLVCLEDQRFPDRDGPFDARAVVRAVWAVVRGSHQGGSTLWQQCARSAYELPKGIFGSTAERKIFEAVVAWRLSRTMTKEELIELYLNTANFAGEIGLPAAAQKHFGKAVRDLNKLETVWLMSTLPCPNGRKDHKRVAKVFEEGVGRLKRRGLLDGPVVVPADFDLKWADKKNRASSFPPGLEGEVRRELRRCHIPDALQGQYQTALTVDRELQSFVQNVVTAEVSRLAARLPAADRKSLEGAVVILDNDTGAMLTVVGSRDPAKQWSNATRASRDTGSVIKGVWLATALESDPNALSRQVLDAPIKGEWPKNAHGSPHRGWLPLQRAFSLSLNSPFVRLGEECRPRLQSLLKTAKLPELKPDHPEQFLGDGYEVQLHLLAAVYAAFGCDGRRHEPHLIARVTNRNTGKCIYRAQDEATVLISPKTAASVNVGLRSVMLEGTARGLPAGLPGGAKTGTSSGPNEASRDLRVVYTEPHGITVAVWVGRERGSLWEGAMSRDVLPLASTIIPKARERFQKMSQRSLYASRLDQ